MYSLVCAEVSQTTRSRGLSEPGARKYVGCPVSAKIERRISRKGIRHNGRETKAVDTGVQIQSGGGKLAARHGARRGLSEILGLLFDGESVASGLPAERTGPLSQSARSLGYVAHPFKNTPL
jgi:hypothetical protein